MQFPVSIELHRSTLLFLLLVAMHGAAAAGAVVLPWPLAWRVFLLVLVGGSLAWAWRRSPVVGLWLVARDRIECVQADGRRIAAQALPESTVISWMIVLRLRLEGEKRICALVVLPDQMKRDEFRRLRLWLRWQVEPKNDVAGKGV